MLRKPFNVAGDCHNAIVTLPPRLGVFAEVGTAVGAGGTVGGTLVAVGAVVGAAEEEEDGATDDAALLADEATDDELLDGATEATEDDELLDAGGTAVGATVGDAHALTIATSATNKKNNLNEPTCIFPSWVLNYPNLRQVQRKVPRRCAKTQLSFDAHPLGIAKPIAV